MTLLLLDSWRCRLNVQSGMNCVLRQCLAVQMKRMSMMDSRQNPDAVKRLIGWQRNRLDDSLREMLFRAAPSAHR